MLLTFKFYTWIKSDSYPTSMALQVFAFGYYLYLYQRDLYFCMLFHCFRCSLVSKWRTPFSNSYSAGKMQSITFYLQRSLFLLHLWRTAFTDIILLIGSFLLSALWIRNLTPCFVLFLLRNLCIVLWEFPSMWQVFLSCCFQDFLFPFDFWQFGYNVSQCGPLWVYTDWDPLRFLNMYVYFLSEIWVVFDQYFFKYSLGPFLSPFSFLDFHNAYIGLRDEVLQVP